MKAKKITKPIDMNIDTATPNNWCPGCFNYPILAGFKNYIVNELRRGRTKEEFALCAGIGCQGKMFDYVRLNGINTLHGRELPTSLGIKIGNPHLDVYAFGGDGATYSEGVSHLIHAARENIDITFTVHNNQVFALTVGQPTPVTEQGFSDKTTPEGVVTKPLNPLKLVLSSNASFVARVFADVKEVEWIYEEAAKHKGFKFIEIIQPCVIFHDDEGYRKHMYKLEETKHNPSNLNEAMKKASEWDYDGIHRNTKIPMGIFYKEKRATLVDNHWQLQKKLVKKK